MAVSDDAAGSGFATVIRSYLVTGVSGAGKTTAA